MFEGRSEEKLKNLIQDIMKESEARLQLHPNDLEITVFQSHGVKEGRAGYLETDGGQLNKLICSVLALGFIGFSPMDASACSCMPQGNILERKALSDMVFSGRLVSVKTDTAQGTKRMGFTIQKAWRQGRRQWVKRIRVESPLESAACGFEMKVGERAIIFATAGKENGRTVYRTNLCSENIVDPGRLQVDSLGMKAPKRPAPKAEESQEF